MNQRDSEQQPKLDSGPFFLIYTKYRLELYVVHNLDKRLLYNVCSDLIFS